MSNLKEVDMKAVFENRQASAQRSLKAVEQVEELRIAEKCIDKSSIKITVQDAGGRCVLASYRFTDLVSDRTILSIQQDIESAIQRRLDDLEVAL